MNDDDRRTALLILMASSFDVRPVWFSVSEFEAEEMPDSEDFGLGGPIGVIDRRFDILLAFNSRRGDVSSESDEDKLVIRGGAIMELLRGEGSDFLDKNPALNRLFF